MRRLRAIVNIQVAGSKGQGSGSGVVFDDKGNTGFVQLPSRAPLSDIFRGLPFGPGALESNADLLEALKGSEVSVRADSSMSGRIVSVVGIEFDLESRPPPIRGRHDCINFVPVGITP